MHSDVFEVASSSDASPFHSRLAASCKSSGRLYEFACRCLNKPCAPGGRSVCMLVFDAVKVDAFSSWQDVNCLVFGRWLLFMWPINFAVFTPAASFSSVVCCDTSDFWWSVMILDACSHPVFTMWAVILEDATRGQTRCWWNCSVSSDGLQPLARWNTLWATFLSCFSFGFHPVWTPSPYFY